ncbi:hypothetical protein Tco_0261569 [Tanacetum coccineum]
MGRVVVEGEGRGIRRGEGAEGRGREGRLRRGETDHAEGVEGQGGRGGKGRREQGWEGEGRDLGWKWQWRMDEGLAEGGASESTEGGEVVLDRRRGQGDGWSEVSRVEGGGWEERGGERIPVHNIPERGSEGEWREEAGRVRRE